MLKLKINSPNVTYTEDAIETRYTYHTNDVKKSDKGIEITPKTQEFDFRTKTTVPKVGMLLVGWGGNNGSTVTGAIIANQQGMSWETKEGTKKANYFGSLTQASTVSIGHDQNGNDVYVPLKDMMPMVDPNDLVVGGWDINGATLDVAMKRAGVFPVDLQRQLAPALKELKPMPSVYYPDFIAANQSDRADNVLPGKDKAVHLEKLRSDIRSFKQANSLDQVVVLWTANTERFAELVPGVNDTADNLLNAIATSHDEVSPSTLFAVASILEGVPFINGSPQNTFVPGCMELAERQNTFIGGDDFKSGQTKIKSVLVDFLVNAGIKPLSIASYNHLGNNDGKNLSAPKQFRSKEISKSNVVDDMVAASTGVLYEEDEHPDHIVVIKYVPTVGDSKRALDEYVSEIFMGGLNTISLHNTCEDSLLASPLIIDLCIMAELMTRVTYKTNGSEYMPFHSVLSILSYLLKAPVVQKDTPVVNSLIRQRAAIENVFRAFLGLQPKHDMLLSHKLWKSTPPTPVAQPKPTAAEE
mmetsp:Transcript_128565/g.181386  ORF Transcript_128565/g.181386 Transcript_128565/m.181386 type:complete len:527 (+) Transcript_128565:100-1680(+)